MYSIRLLILFLLALRVSYASAQDNRYSGLNQKLQRTNSNAEKSRIYFLTADTIAFADSLKAIKMIREGIQLSKNNPMYVGMGYFYLGRRYLDYSLPQANSVLDSAIEILNTIKTKEAYLYLSRAWANKALLAQMAEDNQTFVRLYLEKVIPFAGLADDSLRMADGYSNIAIPFLNHENFDRATFYLQKSIDIFKRLAPNDPRAIDVYAHLAKVYLLQKRPIDAEKYILAGNSLLKKNQESIYGPNFYSMEAMYYIMIRKWNQAENSIKAGLEIAEKLNSRFEIKLLYYQRSELLMAQNKWSEAKEVLLMLLDKGHVEFDTDKKKLFAALSFLEVQMGNYKEAYEWTTKQLDASEKIYQRETKTKIADLEAKYNFVQKEKELIIEREKAKKQQILIWIIIFSLLISLILFYYWWRNRKIKNEREVQNLKQQQQIELGKALLQGEENERKRLARDLHDGLGGMLAGIKLNLSHMVNDKQDLQQVDLQQTIDRLGKSVHELRRISRNMMPESLLQSGLEVALRDLCEDAIVPGTQISSSFFDLHERLAPQVKVMIYRIIQELLTNAIKHAHASKIIVQCSQADEYFFITIEDNGKGFDLDQKKRTSQGLGNIQNRVEILKGKLDIDSSKEGTVINIELYVG
ncbi:tetratricopeptide repeat-containing sensor histidine kinase [Sphingobacterium endophyticum]|uniref:tetratricopeptide repeat-containing sensor histidine kinase n=1 Tax=Sphingobacterium endophyticum TaxID=2546448 RepID=UPI0012E19353|nr:sensor histidine kinase [Sphingobacterium endophyticum]